MLHQHDGRCQFPTINRGSTKVSCNACLDDLGLNLVRNTPKFFPWARYSKAPESFRASGLSPGKTRTHCCGHIVADTNVSPFARACNICCGHKFCFRDTKNVSDFVQKHFLSTTNVFQFAQPEKYHGQQSVRNSVSSFTRAFS